MSEPGGMVKGSLLLARLKYVESELGPEVLAEALARVAPVVQVRGGPIVACVRYPMASAAVLMDVVRARGATPDRWRRMGAFEARGLLGGAYASLLQAQPAETARKLAVLYSTLYTELRATVRQVTDGGATVAFDAHLPADVLEVQVGLIGEAMLLSGARSLRVVAEHGGGGAPCQVLATWSADLEEGSERCEVLPVYGEAAIMDCRRTLRRMCSEIHVPEGDYVALATCVAELARNIVTYAGVGTIEICGVRRQGRTSLRIKAVDSGPGIPHLDEVMSGHYQSRLGMGRGLIGVKRLSDEFDVRTQAGHGTTVEIVKYVRGA